MIGIAILLLYLAIFKEAEPYLLIPIGFGMLLVNLPGSDVYLKSNVDIKYTYETFAQLIGVNSETGRQIFASFGFGDNLDTLEIPLAKIATYITNADGTALTDTVKGILTANGYNDIDANVLSVIKNTAYLYDSEIEGL